MSPKPRYQGPPGFIDHHKGRFKGLPGQGKGIIHIGEGEDSDGELLSLSLGVLVPFHELDHHELARELRGPRPDVGL